MSWRAAMGMKRCGRLANSRPVPCALQGRLSCSHSASTPGGSWIPSISDIGLARNRVLRVASGNQTEGLLIVAGAGSGVSEEETAPGVGQPPRVAVRVPPTLVHQKDVQLNGVRGPDHVGGFFN